MKKILFISLTALLAGACADYLDMDHLLENKLDIEGVFESKDYSDEWLAGVYSHLTGSNADVGTKDHTPFNMISDDMYFNDRRKAADNGRTYSKFKNGEYTENDEQSSWASCWQGIRDASTYINRIDACTELTSAEIVDRKAQARFVRAYLYWLLLRKYGPIPILPLDGLDFTKDYDELAVPRSPYGECAEFIAGELALAARDLPVSARDNRNIARPTRGAALAARAKVYLYSASPLFNGNTDAWAAQLVDHEGKRLVSDVRDEEKWAKAAAAAKEVMDLGVYELYTVPVRHEPGDGTKTGLTNSPWMTYPYYYYPATLAPPHHAEYSTRDFPDGWRDIDPFESYRQLFNGDMRAWGSPELIFTRGANHSSAGIAAMLIHQMPYSMNGWNTHGLTLKMYDAYYMNDGAEFPSGNRPKGYTPAPSVYKSNPDTVEKYRPLPPNVSLQNLHREPRFYASVAYNGSIWEYDDLMVLSATWGHLLYQQVFYYRDGTDGKKPGETQFYLPTGIGIKKYYHPGDGAIAQGVLSSDRRYKSEPAIRYAEVLLIYAEALNELRGGAYSIPSYDGAKSISVSRDPAEMRKGIKPVRMRAGLPDFDSEVYDDPDKFRKKLKRERQIELMGEGHRYFDLRRWKDAPEEESKVITGFNMNMPSAQRELFDIPVDVTYLPSVFVDKMYLWPISHGELRRNRSLTQNPGWTYFTD
ncbi:MAG: RagB/SusD family nutrient uptake outer membrane protein [Prevotellaceae bacterium]|jgi:hypothetical protein|nr:RagB/SusD family nutrient uptake outer membrane protein [Prevotellaceae bacterium]